MLTEIEKSKLKKIADYFYNVRKQELEKNKNILRIVDLDVSIDKIDDFNIYLKVEDIVEILFDDEDTISTSKVSFLIKICRVTYKIINKNIEKTNNYYEYKNHPEIQIHT